MSEEIIKPPTYYTVFAALLGLTVLTVAASFLEVGSWHTLIGMVFAIAKASLVFLFFMHLIKSPRLTWIVLGAGIFWLGILLVLTLADYMTRDWGAY